MIYCRYKGKLSQRRYIRSQTNKSLIYGVIACYFFSIFLINLEVKQATDNTTSAAATKSQSNIR